MSRSTTIIRNIGTDYKYKSASVMALINKVMKDGKKTIASKIVYDALEMIGENSIDTLNQALENLTPEAEVRYKKVGGSVYPVPRQPNQRRKEFLAIAWLLKAARATKGKTMAKSLADEILAASKNEGKAFDERTQLHKLAEGSRAYAVLNW